MDGPSGAAGENPFAVTVPSPGSSNAASPSDVTNEADSEVVDHDLVLGKDDGPSGATVGNPFAVTVPSPGSSNAASPSDVTNEADSEVVDHDLVLGKDDGPSGATVGNPVAVTVPSPGLGSSSSSDVSSEGDLIPDASDGPEVVDLPDHLRPFSEATCFLYTPTSDGWHSEGYGIHFGGGHVFTCAHVLENKTSIDNATFVFAEGTLGPSPFRWGVVSRIAPVAVLFEERPDLACIHLGNYCEDGGRDFANLKPESEHEQREQDFMRKVPGIVGCPTFDNDSGIGWVVLLNGTGVSVSFDFKGNVGSRRIYRVEPSLPHGFSGSSVVDESGAYVGLIYQSVGGESFALSFLEVQKETLTQYINFTNGLRFNKFRFSEDWKVCLPADAHERLTGLPHRDEEAGFHDPQRVKLGGERGVIQTLGRDFEVNNETARANATTYYYRTEARQNIGVILNFPRKSTSRVEFEWASVHFHIIPKIFRELLADTPPTRPYLAENPAQVELAQINFRHADGPEKFLQDDHARFPRVSFSNENPPTARFMFTIINDFWRFLASKKCQEKLAFPHRLERLVLAICTDGVADWAERAVLWEADFGRRRLKVKAIEDVWARVEREGPSGQTLIRPPTLFRDLPWHTLLPTP